MGIVPYITRNLIRQMTVRTVLPRVLVFLGSISLIVYILLSRNGARFTYSHSSYVALGIAIGFEASGIISGIVIWLLKDKKQEPNR